MKSLRILFLFLILTASTVYGQSTPLTFDDHFTEIIEKSNRYQDFKVVKRFKLDRLKNAIEDTVSTYKASIVQLEQDKAAVQATLSATESDLSTTKSELAASQTAVNEMSLFGMQMTKASYNTLMWSVLGILLLLLFVFILRFKNSNSVTRAAKAKLAEVEAEFEGHRSRTLEREQKLRRQLQDEINKNKKPS